MRRWILPACAALLALTLGAGAYFTGQAQVPDNIIRAGIVKVSAEPTAALSVDGLAPGTTAVRPLHVANDGDLPVNVVVTLAKKAGITEFFNALTCRVTEGDAVLYDGPLSTLRTAPVALQPGRRAEMRFALGLPAEAGNSLAGDYCKVTVYVDAEQSR
ncbi:MAG: hypothetical protein IBX62_07500 [Coriobacteriia bacterium]|nr:hypothetical protein [Coriobacteriia bacterium]